MVARIHVILVALVVLMNWVSTTKLFARGGCFLSLKQHHCM